MCGGKRRTAPSAGPRGYYSQSYAHKRGCGHGWGPRRDDHRQGVDSPAGIATTVPGGIVSDFTNSRDVQTTGIASKESKYNDLPVYTSSNNLSYKREKQTEPAVAQSDQPPAYTPRDPAPTNIAAHGSGHVPTHARQLSQHTGFAVFSIFQGPARAESGDLFTLEDRLASLKLGMRESKCAARRAKNQLVHDRWTAEEIKKGGSCGTMSHAEKKMMKAQVKAQMRAVKGAIRDEKRGNRKY